MYRSYCEQLLNTLKHANMPKGEEVPLTLEELFKKLDESKDCHSLLKKYLTKELFGKLKDLKTSNGGTLLQCIRSGCEHLDSHCGIYACDEEAYTLFKDLFDPIIKDYHKVDVIKHPGKNFGDVDNLGFGNLDPSGEMIISTRVRVGRSHAKTLFCPGITKEERSKAEEKTVNALQKLKDDLKGKYYSLEKMTKEEEKKLIEDHFLFKDDDRMLGSAGGYRDWPSGRGIYHNDDKTFLVWLNEEDHLRFISMQKGGDLAQVYTRLVKAMNSLENSGLEFATKEGYGFLTFCPTNLGTAMRASVHIKIPKLSQQPDFKEFCEKLHLQPRGIHGENTESVGGVYDISNKRRLGLTEIDAITEMRKGIEEIMRREKEL